HVASLLSSSLIGRVEDWRAGVGRSLCSPFYRSRSRFFGDDRELYQSPRVLVCGRSRAAVVQWPRSICLARTMRADRFPHAKQFKRHYAHGSGRFLREMGRKIAGPPRLEATVPKFTPLSNQTFLLSL